MLRFLFFLFFFFLSQLNSFSQQFVNGVITDERNIPIPSVTVYVKTFSDQRTLADFNGKYELSLMPGEYFLVFSAKGYDERETYVSIGSANIIGYCNNFLMNEGQDQTCVRVKIEHT